MNQTKKASVKPVKYVTASSYQLIGQDYTVKGLRQIRLFDLRELGYYLDPSNKVTGGNYDTLDGERRGHQTRGGFLFSGYQRQFNRRLSSTFL